MIVMLFFNEVRVQQYLHQHHLDDSVDSMLKRGRLLCKVLVCAHIDLLKIIHAWRDENLCTGLAAASRRCNPRQNSRALQEAPSFLFEKKAAR